MKTLKKKKVLIALDYDPTSQKVAEIGYAFANSMDAEVTLIHVIVDLVQYSTAYLNMGPLLLDSKNNLQSTTNAFLEEVKHQLNDEHINTMTAEGSVAESIVTISKELNFDFIVMGSHSRRWLENILIGSVAREVLSNTLVTLLIVPTKKPCYE